jgi:peroxiredoxin
MKTTIKLYFITTLLSLFSNKAIAQSKSDAKQDSKPITYLLPDGKVFDIMKFDSLSTVWGKDRVTFKHDENDDNKGIIHLMRITDEMKKKMDERKAANNQALSSMLNKNAPEFELTDLQGKKWSLKKLQGKVVVLNFWFTTCIPCIKEIPDLNTLVQDYKDKNVVFLGLTFSNKDQVKKFLTKHPFDYTLLPGSQEIDKKYNISSWPASIVIDKNGMIKKIISSSENIHEELKNEISSLL